MSRSIRIFPSEQERLAESLPMVFLIKFLKVLHRHRKRSSLHLPKVLSLKVKKNIVEKLETSEGVILSPQQQLPAPAKAPSHPQTLSEGVDTTDDPVTKQVWMQYLKALGAFK